MDLLIMSLLDAVEYEPNKPTGVIRIFSAYQKGDKIWERPMVDSPLYKHIRTYYFDDVVFLDFVRENEIRFDEGLAKKLLQNFSVDRKDFECLLVHCSRGINRSPAVGIALNEIFCLGQDADELKREYNKFRRYIYETLKDVAQTLKLP